MRMHGQPVTLSAKLETSKLELTAEEEVEVYL